METVAVVGPFNPAMRAALQEALPGFSLVFLASEAEYPQLAEADYVILRTLSIGADHMKFLKRAKLIQRWGAGFDTVDLAAAGAQGIQVAVTVGMNAVPVAEMAVALTLAVCRNLVPLTNAVMAGSWPRETYSRRSYTISGKTVGLYGGGRVGQKAAALFGAFGARVLYYDPFRLPPEREAALSMTYVEQEDLWPQADILSLHAPLTDDTRGIIGERVLSKMKDGAVLINTAREELVDCQAAAAALRAGKLLGAGFDAIEEPFAQSNPFRGMDNVVLTAHLGGNTVDNAVHMARRCAQQIMAVHAGERLAPPHLVNGQFLPPL